MKKNTFARLVTALCLLLVIASFPLIVAHAAPVFGPSPQEVQPAPTLGDLFTTLLSLGGVSLFFAGIVNAGKKFLPNLFPDGSAPTYTMVFQTFGLVALVVLQLTGRLDLVPVIDQNAGLIANILEGVVALAYQLYIARKGHENVLAGLPVIGTSYSMRSAGE